MIEDDENFDGFNIEPPYVIVLHWYNYIHTKDIYLFCVCCFIIFVHCIYRSTFKDAENVAVVKRLIQEIHSLNPSFQSHNIRSEFLSPEVLLLTLKILSGAAYTYYKTLRQEASMNRRGLSEARKKHRRRRERSIRVRNPSP